ncbi:putative nucleotidyltransferase [Paenibacillus sp. V4I9]|uniref:nucleotidyltransferase domain-containing protein n=1 Tax=Paenibacillus sp. V4I9 TaxID=3042308 RepID=UPI0027855301|nr:nucleotidyltransferase domain-containing protein [Paenibacillus sp. V4I9]MDQ0887831.1 putative nucleotidyltransferase [Paenibacillus sp. V4I9]
MKSPTDQLFINHVAEQLGTVPGVQSVALGGSRATGENRPDSDFDFAIEFCTFAMVYAYDSIVKAG